MTCRMVKRGLIEAVGRGAMIRQERLASSPYSVTHD